MPASGPRQPRGQLVAGDLEGIRPVRPVEGLLRRLGVAGTRRSCPAAACRNTRRSLGAYPGGTSGGCGRVARGSTSQKPPVIRGWMTIIPRSPASSITTHLPRRATPIDRRPTPPPRELLGGAALEQGSGRGPPAGAIVRPDSAGRRPRTIVSTSGSSGIAHPPSMISLHSTRVDRSDAIDSTEFLSCSSRIRHILAEGS